MLEDDFPFRASETDSSHLAGCAIPKGKDHLPNICIFRFELFVSPQGSPTHRLRTRLGLGAGDPFVVGGARAGYGEEIFIFRTKHFRNQ